MPNTLARQQVALAATYIPRGDAPSIAAEWQALVDAGRIGNRAKPSPELSENRARTEAILARHAADRRRSDAAC